MLAFRRRGKKIYIRGTIRVGRETHVVKEHSTGADRREDAEAYRSKFEADIRYEALHGRGGRTQRLTIADAGIRYIARPSGVRSYDVLRIGQINDIVGDYPIARLTDAWSEYRRQRCAGLSPATVQRHRATFLAVVNYLAREEGFDVPKLPRGERVRNKPIRFLWPHEADRLIASYAKHVQPIAATLCWQGLRIGEALRIDWTHVSWSRKSIFIAESKTGVARTLTMHKRVRAALHKLWVSKGSPREGRTFLTHRGKPYSDPRDYKFPSGSGIKKAHATACRTAGITDFRVHDWRHHWACQCVMSGIDLETIKQEGGWKSLRMVERYATVSAAHRTQVMAKLK